MISEGSAELRPHDVGFGLLFATVRDAVVVAEAGTGRIVLWNPAAEAVFGYTAAEARGMGVDALVPDSLRARHRAGLGRFAATGHGAIIDAHAALELPALRKGGASIRVELTLSPLDDPGRGGRLVLAIVRDVTERAALRATEREYTRRLEELAVLKADFTAMVAHELGAPIAAVRALADMLATGEAGAGERVWALDTLRAQAATLPVMPGPRAGTYIPVRGFGTVWQQNPDVQQALGFATAPERGYSALVQRFARGFLLDDPADTLIFALNTVTNRWDSATR